jgi:serine/threonine protein kinase
MAEAAKYKIIRKLEAGGMAEVFWAEMESMEGFKKQVAIKRVLPHLSQNREFIAMFLDEARLSLQFNHANVVQTFDIGVADNTYFITMEYVDGLNLKRVLEFYQKNRMLMDPFYAAYITNEMCKGLFYAHSMRDPHGTKLGVVHRDVSPPNVLISRQGEIKLVDFGLAKATSQIEHTEPGIIKGKFSYLSPEAAWGREVDHRADLFSAGILFFEMMAGGMKLFQGSSDYETVMLVREARIPSIRSINPDVPREFEMILQRTLQAHPDRRYQTAAEMGRDLTNAMFSLGRGVSTFDIAGLVEQIITREPMEVPKEPDIVDLLIEEELGKITSIDGSTDIFSDGSKPISFAEVSGLLDTSGGLEDPRKWVSEYDTNGGASGGSRLAAQGQASGWKEVKVHNLGKQQAAPGAVTAGTSQPAFPVDLTMEESKVKQKEGPRYTLWIILLLMALLGLGAAYYFLIFQR